MKNKIVIKKIISLKGYSLVLVPIILGLVLSFVALVFDFGRAFILKHQLQSAADAAAVAGASMVKVEFAVDDEGKFKFDKTVLNLVEQKAYEEADYYFERNITELIEKGVNILEKKGLVKEGPCFEYYVKAEIPIYLASVFLGTPGKQTVTVVAQAKPVDK